MTNKIMCTVIPNAVGNIGHLSLNNPQALNALDTDMIAVLLKHLIQWRDDSNIAAVFIDSNHEKVFCAGGDIVSMYHALSQNHNSHIIPTYLQTFFTNEYRLDYCIHTYPKPIICWGHGVVMGGGVGLFNGATIRVVTETARLAMPEISIGLFPDVGASYFLNTLPAGVGRFLGLTGASLNARDCIDIGMAEHLIFNDKKALFINSLKALHDISESSITQVLDDLNRCELRELPIGNISPFMGHIATLDATNRITETQYVLEGMIQKHSESAFLQRSVRSFAKGSALSVNLVFDQLLRGQHKTLAECFQMELSMAYQCCLNGEFQEGVRALLIDKDNAPKWLFPDVANVNEDIIEAHFSYFSERLNPLLTLEDEFGVYQKQRLKC